MPRTKISEFSSTPASNTDIDSINIAENCPPSGINDAIRELMAQLKDWQSGTSNDPYVVGSSGSLTLNQGTANGVAYLNGSKVVTSGSALVFDGTNLGVGIASPNTLLDVRGANGIGIRFLETSTGNTNRVQLGTGSGYGYIDATAGVGSTALAFQVGSTEQMRLTSTGLIVGGTAATNTSSGRGNITINGSSSAILSMGTGGTAKGYVYHSGSDMIVNATTGTLALQANGNGALIDSSGNLGLGVTPSAWGSMKAFQINGYGSAIAAWNTNRNTYILSNAYYDSSFKYSTTGAATYYNVSGENGSHSWHTAPSGTAGNAITFTQAMTLAASGGLSVGTTTDAGTGNIGLPAGGQLRYSSTAYITPEDNVSGARIVTGGIIRFDAGGAERARIDSSGRLIVGSTSSNGDGSVEGVARSNSTPGVVAGSRTSGDVGSAALLVTKFDNDSTTSQVFQRFTINNNGTASGQINANGANAVAFGSWSDARLKENIVNLPSQISNVMALRPVEFDYIESEGGGHQVGFIAQEIETIYPDSVGERSDGMKTVTGWSKTEARLVKAIQELKAEFDAYKASHP